MTCCRCPIVIYILQSRWVSVYLKSEKSGLNSVQLCCFSGICRTPRCRQRESSLNPDSRVCTLHLVKYIIKLCTWASLRRLGPKNFLSALCLQGFFCKSTCGISARAVAAATTATILPHNTLQEQCLSLMTERILMALGIAYLGEGFLSAFLRSDSRFFSAIPQGE